MTAVPGGFQSQGKHCLLTRKAGSGLKCLQFQPGQIAPSMQGSQQTQRCQHKGQPIGQAILIVDSDQQHQQQGAGKTVSGQGWYNKYLSLIQVYPAGWRQAPLPPLEKPVFYPFHQSAGTWFSSSSTTDSALYPRPPLSACPSRCATTAGARV